MSGDREVADVGGWQYRYRHQSNYPVCLCKQYRHDSECTATVLREIELRHIIYRLKRLCKLYAMVLLLCKLNQQFRCYRPQNGGFRTLPGPLLANRSWELLPFDTTDVTC
jgi:hypothetical protein